MRRTLAVVAWVITGVLAACAIAELVLAIHPVPTNDDWAVPLGWLAMIVGGLVCLTTYAGRAQFALGPVAIVFAIANGYTADPYFAPDVQRYAEQGLGVVYVVSILVAAATLLGLYQRQAGALLTGILLPVLAFSMLSTGLH